MPERDYFFSIIGTLKPDYLAKIVTNANNVRFSANDIVKPKDYIMMDDSWLQELTKYPYFSCKSYLLTIIEKPGKTVYLLKERSKLVRAQKKAIKHELS